MTHRDTEQTTAHDRLSTRTQGLLAALESDWRRMCGNQNVPAHRGLDPGALDAALPFTFVLQRSQTGSARIRVAGQELHNMLRLEPRGMPFSIFFNPSAKDTVAEMVEAAFSLPAIVSLPLVSQRRFARRPLDAQLF